MTEKDDQREEREINPKGNRSRTREKEINQECWERLYNEGKMSTPLITYPSNSLNGFQHEILNLSLYS